MKYINFQKVTIKNFLSVGEEPVEVDFNTGLNIITGANKDKVDRRNGVGKSTIADSIYFALYGDTLRPVKKDHIINNITQRNCCVELLFDVNCDGTKSVYKIIRQLAPSKCHLFKDGDDITRDSISNTTEHVIDLLNTTSEVFQNCVIMTVNNAIPFMAKKKLEKRKFIEGIFNLQVFSNMLASVRSEYNTVVKDLDIECAKYEEISNTLAAYAEQKQVNESEFARSQEKLTTRLDHNTSLSKELERKLSEIEDISTNDVTETITQLDSAVVKLDTSLQTMISKNGTINAMLELRKKECDKIDSDHTTCPVCLTELNSDHKQFIQSEKEKISLEIGNLTEKIAVTNKKLKEITEAREKLRVAKKRQTDKLTSAHLIGEKRKNYKQQLAQLKTQAVDIKDDLRSLKKTDNTVDKYISEANIRLSKTQNVIDTIKKDINKLDIIKFIVSEEGVKSYIVRKILQLFNAKLSHYLKKMDSNCICVFNEYFEEEIIDEKGKLCSYFNFSGAERKNIDLACLFAFMDIRRLQGDVAFNFSMYDELFDSSLDERGVELVIDILKERIDDHNECVMVISHRKESTKLATGEIIFLEKQNGVTVRVETPENELK
jgi:DNA repair exonuclease SbcCD ATPase subunit